LADGSNELRCPQRKNVGTAVSCSLVIQVLLYYCMYVSLLYLMLYNLQNVPIKTAIGALSTRCIKTIVGFYNVQDIDTDTTLSSMVFYFAILLCKTNIEVFCFHWNLHARHCLADGSNELRCPQRKNVGTAVSCSLVIQVLLYYCMYVSLLTNVEKQEPSRG
jgi:hypothetical protein